MRNDSLVKKEILITIFDSWLMKGAGAIVGTFF